MGERDRNNKRWVMLMVGKVRMRDGGVGIGGGMGKRKLGLSLWGRGIKRKYVEGRVKMDKNAWRRLGCGGVRARTV